MRRPSRRDRRVPAIGSPGAPIPAYVYTLVLRNIGDNQILMLVAKILDDDQSGGILARTPINKPPPTTDSVRVYTSTARVDVSDVTMTPTGSVTVTLAQSHAGYLYVVVPPYQPELATIDGSTNLGGIGAVFMSAP